MGGRQPFGAQVRGVMLLFRIDDFARHGYIRYQKLKQREDSMLGVLTQCSRDSLN